MPQKSQLCALDLGFPNYRVFLLHAHAGVELTATSTTVLKLGTNTILTVESTPSTE
jgi:hypothetical protein